MAEYSEQKIFSLKALNESILQLFQKQLGGRTFWIRAEISQINFHHSGQTYLELADEREGKLLAKASAVIWKSDWERMLEELGPDCRQVLKKGSEIQCCVEVSFHVIHGLKLRILTLDLSYHLGQLERRKQETLRYLEKNGLLRLNARTVLPAVVQRLALVAAPDSAGFADVVRHLRNNPSGYRFSLQVFRSSVQGEGAAASLCAALAAISALPLQTFDAVILLRGGGSTLDLDVFNDRSLAETIARMPLPVITGIGHETDFSVADAVAFHHEKTPTAAAAWLLQRMADFEADQQQKTQRIQFLSVRLLQEYHRTVSTFQKNLRAALQAAQQRARSRLEAEGNRIARLGREVLHRQGNINQVYRERIRSAARRTVQQEQPARLRQQRMQWEMLSRQLLRQSEQELREARRIRIPLQQFFRAENQRWSGTASLLTIAHPETTLSRGYAILSDEDGVFGPGHVFQTGDALTITTARQKLQAGIQDTTARNPRSPIHETGKTDV